MSLSRRLVDWQKVTGARSCQVAGFAAQRDHSAPCPCSKVVVVGDWRFQPSNQIISRMHLDGAPSSAIPATGALAASLRPMRKPQPHHVGPPPGCGASGRKRQEKAPLKWFRVAARLLHRRPRRRRDIDPSFLQSASWRGPEKLCPTPTTDHCVSTEAASTAIALCSAAIGPCLPRFAVVLLILCRICHRRDGQGCCGHRHFQCHVQWSKRSPR